MKTAGRLFLFFSALVLFGGPACQSFFPVETWNVDQQGLVFSGDVYLYLHVPNQSAEVYNEGQQPMWLEVSVRENDGTYSSKFWVYLSCYGEARRDCFVEYGDEVMIMFWRKGLGDTLTTYYQIVR
ncbi:MAG: hypothetical protein PHV78_00590 [Patescibacteria group bacterium]|nr:hypothetical protein [Patescibacteria group bacterium]MDD5121330.1 hypothetical protein [Patescibacteria group bacterium]MDD5221815.1 hypothetical protein [Patescibacteria group bacterium]MDD5395751.1 hypothetical protein [Patescibacteria group bacterium]